jgi:threonine dehydrogenase-like Zn-dependent dehydrogenase
MPIPMQGRVGGSALSSATGAGIEDTSGGSAPAPCREPVSGRAVTGTTTGSRRAATCRAVVFTGAESFEVREFAVPDPPPGGAILRVEAVGMCGSDVAQWHGIRALPDSDYPIVPGHEIVGVIDRLDAAAAFSVGEGDRVAVDECLERSVRPRVYGYTSMPGAEPVGLYGGYGEYLVLFPGTTVHRLTAARPPAELTLFEPLANALNWIDIAQVRPNEVAVVQGPGHQGLAVVQALRSAGVERVIVLGTGDDALRLDTAVQLGAEAALDVTGIDAVEAVAERTSGAMADVVFEVTPAVSALSMSVALSNAGGRVLLAGLKEGRNVEVVTDTIVNKGLRLFGASAYTPDSMARAVAAINSGLIDTRPLRGRVLDLEHVDEAINLLLRRRPGDDAVRVTLRHRHP